MSLMKVKLVGAIYGLAIGDAMGAPVEGWPAEKILAKFNSLEGFLPVTHDGNPQIGKGNGRITDDTLMTEALIRAYIKCGHHMDAHDYKTYLLPEIVETEVWLPERQQIMPIFDRLFWPEKYPWQRLIINNADPRSAGIGNMVNCGVAMFMLPVAAVNAGDPYAAYQEAASLGLAHNESFAIEAAAVMAAAGAAALGGSSTIDEVIESAVDLARAGTEEAIIAIVESVDKTDSIESFINKARNAVAPYDQRTGYTKAGAPLKQAGISDIGQPSNLKSIEELPVALAALKYGDGDFYKTLKAGVFYGRDCDSIAGMAGSLFGAIYGEDSLPKSLKQDVNQANNRNFTRLGEEFLKVITNIFEQDKKRLEKRRAIFGA